MVLSAFLALGACLHQPVFDEEKWQKKVAAEEAALVYAGHREGDRYHNPWLPEEERGLKDLLKWRFSEKLPYNDQEAAYLPQILPDVRKRIEAFGRDDFLVWIGHATFIIRVNGQYWLTDPVFSERAFVPKRKTPPAMSLKDLLHVAPSINVIISHDHYDHLDKATIKALPTSTRFFVPPGLADYIKGLGRQDVTELDWWEESDRGDSIRLISLPAQHWSRRFGLPANSSLWASYVLVTPSATIYFAGDSGYFVGYKEIGRRFPGIDYAIMPLGAYHPRWFMHYAHMSASESIDAFEDLGARNYVPMQWGTFALGDEPVGYPAIDLRRTIESKHLDSSRFRIMDIGEILPLTK
jgi:N-acyl-phosphatidylethanolamine-hydrolysing phospholipase D